jgi:hypothetical protein
MCHVGVLVRAGTWVVQQPYSNKYLLSNLAVLNFTFQAQLVGLVVKMSHAAAGNAIPSLLRTLKALHVDITAVVCRCRQQMQQPIHYICFIVITLISTIESRCQPCPAAMSTDTCSASWVLTLHEMPVT